MVLGPQREWTGLDRVSPSNFSGAFDAKRAHRDGAIRTAPDDASIDPSSKVDGVRHVMNVSGGTCGGKWMRGLRLDEHDSLDPEQCARHVNCTLSCRMQAQLVQTETDMAHGHTRTHFQTERSCDPPS